MTSRDRIVRSRLWRTGVLEKEDFPLQDVSEFLDEADCLVWVDLCEPDPDHLDELATELGLVPQAVEDALARLGIPRPDPDDEELPRRVVEIVYQDVDESLWGAAEWSVRAQLAYLADR